MSKMCVHIKSMEYRQEMEKNPYQIGQGPEIL